MTGAHRRYNPLLDEWVLCSPGRLRRPWRGESSSESPEPPPEHDPHCYLCPGNARAGGERNPQYRGVFTFDNDFPALEPEPVPVGTGETGRFEETVLFRAEPERGRCRVLCFSPRHDLHFPDLEPRAVVDVIDAWADESERLRRDDEAAYVQVFENRGVMMGASSPHPHGQVWGVGHVPSLPARKARILGDYAAAQGSDLLGDYLDEELRREERLVDSTASWVQLVPFWAVWPFETMLVPRRPVGRLSELTPEERDDLGVILGSATKRYDRLFRVPFPYSFGWFECPAGKNDGFRLHASYLPPLLRSAAIRKFLVGYELTAEPQRDFLPEEAAERLRAVTRERIS